MASSSNPPLPLDFADGSVTVGDGPVRVTLEPGSTASWVRTGSEFDMDAPSSPSSSGYAAERCSSSVTTEIEEKNINVEIDDTLRGISLSKTTWIPGKRHLHEVSA